MSGDIDLRGNLACWAFTTRRLARRLSRHYDAVLAPVGLRTTQFTLLSTVAVMGPVSVGRLADKLGMESSAAGRGADVLVKAGFIERRVGDSRRERLLSITPSGRDKLTEAQPLWQSAQDQLDALIGPFEADMREHMEAVVEALDGPDFSLKK